MLQVSPTLKCWAKVHCRTPAALQNLSSIVSSETKQAWHQGARTRRTKTRASLLGGEALGGPLVCLLMCFDMSWCLLFYFVGGDVWGRQSAQSDNNKGDAVEVSIHVMCITAFGRSWFRLDSKQKCVSFSWRINCECEVDCELGPGNIMQYWANAGIMYNTRSCFMSKVHLDEPVYHISWVTAVARNCAVCAIEHQWICGQRAQQRQLELWPSEANLLLVHM